MVMMPTCNGAAKSTSCVKRSPRRHPRLKIPPARLAGENGVPETTVLRLAIRIRKRDGPRKRNVIEAEIPYARKRHAERAEGHDGPDDRPGEQIIPMVKLIDGQSARDQTGAEDGRIRRDQLPHGRVVVGEDLEFGVEVEIEEDEAGEGGRGVPGRHRFQGVVDFLLVARADGAVEHDGLEALAGALQAAGVGGADGEEVGAEATDEPFDEDLEDGCGDERVEQPDSLEKMVSWSKLERK